MQTARKKQLYLSSIRRLRSFSSQDLCMPFACFSAAFWRNSFEVFYWEMTTHSLSVGKRGEGFSSHGLGFFMRQQQGITIASIEEKNGISLLHTELERTGEQIAYLTPAVQVVTCMLPTKEIYPSLDYKIPAGQPLREFCLHLWSIMFLMHRLELMQHSACLILGHCLLLQESKQVNPAPHFSHCLLSLTDPGCGLETSWRKC